MQGGKYWSVRCADCQSMVPNLTQTVDGVNTTRTLMVIFNEVSACIKFRRVWKSFTLFWGEWKAMTCRYTFILMEENTRRDTPVLSLMFEFNESIWVLYLCSIVCHHCKACVTIPTEKNKPSILTCGIYEFAIIIWLSFQNMLHMYLEIQRS